ncbi:MAG TPA: PilN domain-containing protein [Solirubrobacterales bacterium]|nr:PilN domain-containing protein [Solirubrobacterales bacterium]
MRPVNLIPAEERRDGHGPMRTGPVPYLLVGALVAVLAGVTALVVIGNQISDRKSEVAKLEREDAVAGARAQRLAGYTQFRGLREKRVQTVTSLADSRFDWERVMRELSLVLPHDVWLTSLEASAAPGSEGGGSGGSGSLSGSIKGPSLTIAGCATGHEAVAGFVTALKEIAGVTRVGVESSELGTESGSGGGSEGSSGGGSGSDCQVRPSFATFNMVVAFDAAPVPQLESTGEAPASAPEQAQAASSATSESSSASSESSSSSSSSSSSEGGG